MKESRLTETRFEVSLCTCAPADAKKNRAIEIEWRNLDFINKQFTKVNHYLLGRDHNFRLLGIHQNYRVKLLICIKLQEI
jgi:hypothetical protein